MFLVIMPILWLPIKMWIYLLMFFFKFLFGILFVYYYAHPKQRNHSSTTGSLFMFRIAYDIIVINFITTLITNIDIKYIIYGIAPDQPKKANKDEIFAEFMIQFFVIMIPQIFIEYFVVYRMSVKNAIMRSTWQAENWRRQKEFEENHNDKCWVVTGKVGGWLKGTDKP